MTTACNPPVAIHPVEVVMIEAEGWMANAPWWVISAAIHVMLILAAALVYVERFMPLESTEVLVTVPPVNAGIFTAPELDRPRDVFERKGIPKESAEHIPSAVEEPSIFFPEAKLSDHHESADGEDYHTMKGDSKEYLSYIRGEGGGFRGRQPGKGPGVYDNIGPGGGGGGSGRYGVRDRGGRENLVNDNGGSQATESSVLAALRWLARHQAADGSWDSDGFSSVCGHYVKGSCNGPGYPEYDAGNTGLALLAFLGAGYTHLSRDTYDGIHFGQVVKKGLLWMMANQDSEGCIGGRSASKYMYNHAIATLAMSEAYGMTCGMPSSQLLKDPTMKAVNFLIAAQNPYKGWRYTARSGDNDSSVTGWCVMALKSAELSGIAVPRSGYDGAKAWLDEVTGSDFRVGYNEKGTGQVVVQGKSEHFANHEALTAIGIMSRIFIDKDRGDPRLKGGAEMLVKDLPAWEGVKIDFYYWYYASLALFQYDGPSGRCWNAWNEHMKKALVTNQRRQSDGCANGSWDPIDRWGFEGGRVYATAINALTLEVYYRYDNVFGTGVKRR